jgi:hypothetical protein
MKKWYILITILTVSSFLMGLICKNSFKDNGIMAIRTIEDVRELNCNLNQLFTEEDTELFISDYSDVLLKELPNDINVLIVKPTNSIRQYNFTITQEVEIVEVLIGRAEIGKAVELVISGGGVYDQIYKYHNYDNSRPLFFGMVNIMFYDNLYLTFVKEMNTSDYTDVKRYQIGFPLFGAFNLTDNYSIPIDKPVNTIPYNDFGNSEFLCDSPDTLEKLLKFKQQVIEQFLTSVQLEHLKLNCSLKSIEKFIWKFI